MKKNSALVILLAIVTATSAQQIKTSPILTKQNYLKKSRNENKAAWLFLSSGAALASTSIMVLYPKDYSSDYGYPINSYKQIHRAHLAEVFFWTGFGSMLTSIPFFIVSKRNKWEGKSISALIKMESTSIFQGYTGIYVPYPAISMKISLD